MALLILHRDDVLSQACVTAMLRIPKTELNVWLGEKKAAERCYHHTIQINQHQEKVYRAQKSTAGFDKEE